MSPGAAAGGLAWEREIFGSMDWTALQPEMLP
jgi:hypothetical protein